MFHFLDYKLNNQLSKTNVGSCGAAGTRRDKVLSHSVDKYHQYSFIKENAFIKLALKYSNFLRFIQTFPRSDLVPDLLPFLFSSSDLLTLNDRSDLSYQLPGSRLMSTATSDAVNTSSRSAWCVPGVCEWRTADVRAGDNGSPHFLSASHGNTFIPRGNMQILTSP